jgi:hypothetical protein
VCHLVLFLVILAGALLGMAPYLAFLGSLWLAGVYLAGALLVALTVTFRQVSAKNETPRFVENLCGVLGISAYSAGGAVIGFLLYGLAYGLTELVGLVDRWLQFGLQANPVSVAFWASGPFSLLFSLLALSFTPIPRALFPEVAGVASAYHGQSLRGNLRWAIPLVVAGAVLSILTYFLWPDAGWAYLIALSLMSSGGKESMDVARTWSPAVVLGSEAVQAMQKLYGILGYETVVSPRTKDTDEEVDSLLKKVDLLAIREEDVLMIELKTAAQGSRTVSAADASILPIAARVVARYLSKDSQLPVRVQPVLVLIGQTATADLGRLAQDESVKVLSLTENVVREVLKTEDADVLRQLAQRYLLAGPALISAPSAPSVTTDDAAAGGATAGVAP